MEQSNVLYNDIDKMLISVAIFIGIMSLFIPIWWLLSFILAISIFIWGLLRPKDLYYVMVFTIPFSERIRALPISFSINDIMVLWCFVGVFLQFFLKNQRINLSTKIDGWIIGLLFLYTAAGFTSEGPTGYLSSFKFLEVVFVYYMTIYFIRTNQVKISKIIKLIIYTALFQSLFGILQSLTGSFGANFQSARNILGYIGIGSTTVWHGIGTLGHFNMLGNYLITVVLFYLPINKYALKNTQKSFLAFLIFLIGIYMTYSRGSWMGLLFGFFLFVLLTYKNKFKLNLLFVSSFAFITYAYLFLKDTSYVQTLSPRNAIWEGVFASVSSSLKHFYFGAGLNSYEQTVWNYLPQDDIFWYAHNFYLLCWQETGLIGFIVIFGFLIYILFNSIYSFKKNHGLRKIMNLAIVLSVFSIFFVSIFDHAYSLTFFKILLFLFLGLVYAKNNRKIKNEY